MAPHWKSWLQDIRAKRPHRNIYAETMENLGALDKIAVWITDHVGTMGFFIAIFLWTALWLGWNLLAPSRLQFDPPMGFVFWLFISNLIQILLMPLIMVGQNIQGKHAEARAEHDLEINIKAEKEIEVILHHIEEQNDMLIAMLENSGIDSGDALKKIRERRAGMSPAPADGPPGRMDPPKSIDIPALSDRDRKRQKAASRVTTLLAALLIIAIAVGLGLAALGFPNHSGWSRLLH